MRQCTRCPFEVTYPHTVVIDNQVHEICDDCMEDLINEHNRECDEQEIERELRQMEGD